jgi:IS4 transposase
MSNWTNIVMLRERGLELVSRLNKAHRKADFRKGTRLGKEDHLVCWRKPSSIRSLDWKTYKALPDDLMIREARIHVSQRGFRTKSFVIVTTLLDPEQTTKEDLAQLYRARWNNELDLRSIKISLQMDILRCKTPELVRKEVWTHILAYNLVRTIMAQAAVKHDLEPRTISFKGALQILEAFQPVIALQGTRNWKHRLYLYHQLLDAVFLSPTAWEIGLTDLSLDFANAGAKSTSSS